MNRREAISALMSLPATATITAAKVQPHDVIVIECDEPVSEDVAVYMKQQLEQVWPGRKAIVLSGGLKIKIVRETA